MDSASVYWMHASVPALQRPHPRLNHCSDRSCALPLMPDSSPAAARHPSLPNRCRAPVKTLDTRLHRIYIRGVGRIPCTLCAAPVFIAPRTSPFATASSRASVLSPPPPRATPWTAPAACGARGRALEIQVAQSEDGRIFVDSLGQRMLRARAAARARRASRAEMAGADHGRFRRVRRLGATPSAVIDCS